MLPRQRCLYKHFDLKQIPERKRLSALELNVDGWSPYSRYGSYVLWCNHHAMVWLWELRESELESPGPFIRVMPESALIPPPVASQPLCRLVALGQGCEGQAWRNGILESSRWWSHTPPVEEWSLFQRASGVTPDPVVPQAEKIPFAAYPWARSRIRLWVELQRHETLWVTAIFAVLLAVILVQGIGLLRWSGALGNVEQRRATVREQARPLLESRRQALLVQSQIFTLKKLLKSPPQSTLLYGVAKRLAPGVKIVSWKYQNHALQFTLHSRKTLDPSHYVKVFQSLPFLENLGLGSNSSSRDLVITAQVTFTKVVASEVGQ